MACLIAANHHAKSVPYIVTKPRPVSKLLVAIAAAFIAAPIASLNPMVATGWVSGLVQAGIYKPTVADLEDLPKATESVKGFWMNPVSRILLVVVMANIGSSLGTFIAGS